MESRPSGPHCCDDELENFSFARRGVSIGPGGPHCCDHGVTPHNVLGYVFQSGRVALIVATRGADETLRSVEFQSGRVALIVATQGHPTGFTTGFQSGRVALIVATMPAYRATYADVSIGPGGPHCCDCRAVALGTVICGNLNCKLQLRPNG